MKNYHDIYQKASDSVKNRVKPELVKELKEINEIIDKMNNTATVKLNNISEEKALYDTVIDYLVEDLSITNDEKRVLKTSLYMK